MNPRNICPGRTPVLAYGATICYANRVPGSARGCVLTLGYDLLNRLTSKASSGAGCGTQVNTTFTYDAGDNSKGRRTKAENTVDSIVSEWSYDERGRVQAETVMGETTEWDYNFADLPTWMKYPDGEIVNYTYDSRMLLNTLSNGATNYVQSTTYDEASRVDKRTLGNNLVQNYDYYAWNEKAVLNGLQTGQGGRLKNLNAGSLQNLSYLYDAMGNIRSITDSIANETQSFSYDTLDRLTSATVTGGPAPYTEKYSYDGRTGNVLSKTSNTYVPPAPNPGTNGLAAWWSLDENSGTRLDSHNGNHLQDNNTVGSTTGLKGRAASFVPADQEVLSIPDNALLSGGNTDFTLMANVYLNNNTNTFVILDKSDNASAYDYRLTHISGTGFRFKVGSSAFVDSGAVTANAWHLVIAWHDAVNDTINIQVDNGTVKSVSFTTGTTDTSNPLTIGALPNGTYVLDGRLDEVALYRRVLTLEERAWRYNNGQGRTYSGLGMGYVYGDSAHAHAATSLSNGNSYQYDLNGNQTRRIIGTDTYLLAYDAENRLVKVCKDTSSNGVCETSEEVAKFTYDADGKRVKSLLGSETTLFIGGHYEVMNPGSTQTVTKYYFVGAQRIATLAPHASAGVRKYVIPSSMNVEYLLGDHLGSTSLTTDADGAKVSEIRYKAWGEIRYSWTSQVASTPAYKISSYTFTGQYADSYINLLWYGSRHYDPELGRFIQPDSIVPLASQGVQAWDRYAYVNNAPTRYTDPTGHRACGDEEAINCETGLLNNPKKNTNKGCRQGECLGITRNPCLMRRFSCQGLLTEPVTITVANIDPGAPEDAGLPMEGYTPPTSFDYISATIDGLMWIYYNTPAYSWATGSSAQGIIPVVHNNESGMNIIPAVGVYNNTGYDLRVGIVSVNGETLATASSLIPNNSLGAVPLTDPVLNFGTTNISVKINFLAIRSNGTMFGYGQIRYNGPSYVPPIGPPLPP